MRGIYIGTIALLFFGQVLFPLFSMKKTVIPSTSQQASQPSSSADITAETFKVKLVKEEKIIEISAFDYICGVVGAEMPAEYNEEALKAQAIAAYSFALFRKQENKNKDYDITDSTSPDQAFLTEQMQKERWGDNYSRYIEKIEKAVDSVWGKRITYNGETAMSIFHDTSGGKTESAELLWGGSYPYLVPVESVGDLLSPQYLSEATFTTDEFKAAFKDYDISFGQNTDRWITDKKCSDSGSVLTIMVGNKQLKGSEVRTALGLKSANFDVEVSDGKFVFSVRGYGHGVGMSQYGAQFMALQGNTYEEILLWYYKGCEIT